jgi:hypothetical protein
LNHELRKHAGWRSVIICAPQASTTLPEIDLVVLTSGDA